MANQENQTPYKESLATLKRISENMRNQTDPDIDAIIPQVDEATKAYSICNERIEKVKTLLAERMPAAESE